MIVDDQLIETARRTLIDHFGEGPGAATAVYTLDGTTLTSVAVHTASPSSSIAPETGALAEAAQRKERVSAVVTIQRDVTDGPIRYSSPSGVALDQLAQVAASETQVVVHDILNEENFWVRNLKVLVPSHLSDLAFVGNFDGGMRDIASELRQLSNVQGVPSARDRFATTLRHALEAPLIRRYAQPVGKPGRWDDFRHPCQMRSAALRHLWFAFEAATHAFFDAIFTAHTEELTRLGCNSSDIVKLRQGGESLRLVFSNLVVWVGDQKPIANALPFVPYHSHLIEQGEPMDVSLPLRDRGDADIDTYSLNEVSRLLLTKGPGGISHYLHDRGLFTYPVFPNGSGHCPFSATAIAVYEETGRAIPELLADDLFLRTEPSNPA